MKIDEKIEAQKQELKKAVEDFLQDCPGDKSKYPDLDERSLANVFFDIYFEHRQKATDLDIKDYKDTLEHKFWAYKDITSGPITAYIYVGKVHGSESALYVDCVSLEFSESEYADENYFDFDAYRQMTLHSIFSLNDLSKHFEEITEEEFMSHLEDFAKKAPIMIKDWTEWWKTYPHHNEADEEEMTDPTKITLKDE